jgi:hypothetical protein
MTRYIRQLVICFLLLSGCTVNHGDFSVISSKLVNLDEFELDKKDRVRRVEGKQVVHLIFGFIPVGDDFPPTLEGAMDDAFRYTDGDVMTDANVKSWQWAVPYIYGQAGWSIEGDVVKTRKN